MTYDFQYKDDEIVTSAEEVIRLFIRNIVQQEEKKEEKKTQVNTEHNIHIHTTLQRTSYTQHYKIGRTLLLMTNRKSHTRFRLVPK